MDNHDSEMTRQQYRASLNKDQSESTSADPEAKAVGQESEKLNNSARANYAAESAQTAEELKVRRLAKKLNWAILGLSIAIVIVFLILFLTP